VLLNTDADCYGGSDFTNGRDATAEPESWHQQPASLFVTLPPLATVILRLDGTAGPQARGATR
jgi:1,4-alpha-glucan branching enzyme